LGLSWAFQFLPFIYGSLASMALSLKSIRVKARSM
jgi:hypothetical protein